MRYLTHADLGPMEIEALDISTHSSRLSTDLLLCSSPIYSSASWESTPMYGTAYVPFVASSIYVMFSTLERRDGKV